MEIVKQPELLINKVLAKSSSVELMQNFGNLTLDKLVHQSRPSLRLLQKQHTPEKLNTVCEILLADFSASFAKPLPEMQVQELTAELVFTELSQLSLEDVFVALRELKYKPTFGDLSTNKILAHFADYRKRRQTAIELKNYNEHLSQGGTSAPMSSAELDKLERAASRKRFR